MTDPILYACLELLRERMLLLKSDAGVKILEETVQELKRLNAELELKTQTNVKSSYWQPKCFLVYGDDE